MMQEDDQRSAIVLTGIVRVFVTLDSGRERTLREVTAGGAIGIGAFAGLPNSVSAQALVDSDLLELDIKQLVSLAGTDPTLAIALLREVSARLRDTEQLLAAQSGPVSQRLARQLLDRAAETRDDPEVAHVSQTELATQLGCSREWIARILGDWRRQRLVEVYARRRIRILDAVRLLLVARGMPPGSMS